MCAHPFDDDPRAADRRYGEAIITRPLRHANVPISIARRSGSFIEPAWLDPVKPLVSLVFVRGAVGLILAFIGALLHRLIR